MNIFDEQASGRAGPRLGPSRHVILSGSSVIWVGVIMLVIVFVLYVDGKKSNSKEE